MPFQVSHQELWQAEVLHRDIRVNNTLMGPEDAEPGFRGVLIDLDLAISTTRQDNLAGVDYRTGTRAFQGLHLLYELDLPTPDFVDDVSDAGDESPPTFALLIAILTIWNPSTTPLYGSAAAMRAQMTNEKEYQSLLRPLLPYLQELHAVMRELCCVKRHEAKPGAPVSTLYPDADLHYDRVLSIFDNALKDPGILEDKPRTSLATSHASAIVAPTELPSIRNNLTDSQTFKNNANTSRKRSFNFPEDEEKSNDDDKAPRTRHQKRVRSASLVPHTQGSASASHSRNKSA
ncbi:hypothetical protein AX16_004485 [Volvariella volvacea WC 439]|nr:hypothetical protein AX16_004485 [Volvariella volvacea WC 439]